MNLETRSEVKVNKVTVTPKWYVAQHHSKMHPKTKLWIPTSNNVGDYSRNGVREVQSHSDPIMVSDTPSYQDASTHQIWDAYLK